MIENKIEPLAAELKSAIAELGQVERDRTACLERWANLRMQLQKEKNGRGVSLMHHYEHETASLHLLDGRLEECKRRVREADGRLGGEVQRWALANRMEFSRSRQFPGRAGENIAPQCP
jgi:hypothetical protein